MLWQVFLAAENWKQLPPAEEAVRMRKARTPPHRAGIMTAGLCKCELQARPQMFDIDAIATRADCCASFSWPSTQPRCAGLHVHDSQAWKQALSAWCAGWLCSEHCGSQRCALGLLGCALAAMAAGMTSCYAV